LSDDAPHKVGEELRSINEALRRISSTLHEHTRKLEIAVEGTYANSGGDPRVRLLRDSLNISSMAELELGRLTQTLRRFHATLQLDRQAQNSSNSISERERETLTTSIKALEKQRTDLETLYEIARTLNSTLDFDEVLCVVMDRVIEVVKAERGFLMLINPADGALQFTIARDKEAHTIPANSFDYNMSRGIVMRVIKTETPVIADDAQTDDVLREHESIMAYNIRSVMCAPLIVRDNCIGAVYVDSRINTNLFGPKHRDLLLTFCNQAAIAIDNARLFADLNKAIEQVRQDKRYMDNIFSSIANGVITTDSSGIITTFNDRAAQILQLDAMAVVGKHYQDAFKERPQVGLAEMLRWALVQHEHGTIVPKDVECDIPERGWVNLSLYVSALRDAQGAHIGMTLVLDDRTELKRSQREVKQIRRMFERYVHPSVVEQLIKDPKAVHLGGETKEISVVFADIRGYTRLSETMPPEQVMNLINRYLTIMCEAIWEEEGTLTAFQGDALMAIFNAPLPEKMHALKAVRAAWKMKMAVLAYQRSRPEETLVSFGFGVNTGLATVGNVGSQERLQNYTAIGDAVNIASRLQSSVSDNNILLNETTYMQVYHHVQVGQAFSLDVKNKARPLKVRFLVGCDFSS